MGLLVVFFPALCVFFAATTLLMPIHSMVYGEKHAPGETPLGRLFIGATVLATAGAAVAWVALIIRATLRAI